MIALTFLLYAYLNAESLSASVAFTTLSLINLLRLPFFWLPLSITFLQQYKIMFGRIRDFVVDQPEIELVDRDVREGVIPGKFLIYNVSCKKKTLIFIRNHYQKR